MLRAPGHPANTMAVNGGKSRSEQHSRWDGGFQDHYLQFIWLDFRKAKATRSMLCHILGFALHEYDLSEMQRQGMMVRGRVRSRLLHDQQSCPCHGQDSHP